MTVSSREGDGFANGLHRVYHGFMRIPTTQQLLADPEGKEEAVVGAGAQDDDYQDLLGEA